MYQVLKQTLVDLFTCMNLAAELLIQHIPTPIQPKLEDCSRTQQTSSFPLLLTDTFVPHMHLANYGMASIMHAAVPRLLITPNTGGSIHTPRAPQLSSGCGLLLAPLRLALSVMCAHVPESGGGAIRLLAPAGVRPPALTVPPDRYISANCSAALLQSVRL